MMSVEECDLERRWLVWRPIFGTRTPSAMNGGLGCLGMCFTWRSVKGLWRTSLSASRCTLRAPQPRFWSGCAGRVWWVAMKPVPEWTGEISGNGCFKLAHQLRDCQYAIAAGDILFAPRMRAVLLRAFVIHKRRERLADSTLYHYRYDLRCRLEAALNLHPTHPTRDSTPETVCRFEGAPVSVFGRGFHSPNHHSE